LTTELSFIDLFCGIGGFHIAAANSARQLGLKATCQFASDIDEEAKDAYEANFGFRPAGDITKIQAEAIPEHDVLFAGFPCQAFSIIGDRRGFQDARGTLFFDIARILKAKRPRAFVLENVKQLKGHDRGSTLKTILQITSELGYHVEYKVLNALDFGLPQKRETILNVGFKTDEDGAFCWPEGRREDMQSLDALLEDDRCVDLSYFASETIRQRRESAVGLKDLPEGRSIWHENKSGNISPLPYSCALRAGASYNYLLVDGRRRLTMREMLRLQGFPDDYKIVCGYSATRKQAGNSVPVPMIAAVIREVFLALQQSTNGALSPDREKRKG